MNANGTYQGTTQSSLASPIGLAAYAANPKYNAAYKSAGAYVPQTALQKNIGIKSANPLSGNYRPTNRDMDVGAGAENVPLHHQQPRDVARPTATIDDTVAPTAVAVQRDFLEQMIRNARNQTMNQRPPQYMVLYQ